MELDPRNPWNRAREQVLEAGLGRGRHGNGVAIATQARCKPMEISEMDVANSGDRSVSPAYKVPHLNP